MSAATPSARWRARYEAMERARDEVTLRADQYQTEVVRRLKDLAVQGHCSGSVVGWVKPRVSDRGKQGACKVISFSENADGKFGAHPAVRLTNLKTLADGALLTMAIKLDVRKGRLISYSIGLHGFTRDDERRAWYARVDLHEEGDEELRGDSHGGYCNHPLLHCHVGLDASRRELPEPRSPLLWLMPWDALEWLIATVDSRRDPEPRPAARVDIADQASMSFWCKRLEISPERLRNLVQRHGPRVFDIKRALEL